MSEENVNINENVNEPTSTEPSVEAQAQPQVNANPDLEAIIASRMEEERAKLLTDFKSKLDNAYSARDELIKEKVALEEAKKAAELKQMEEEGRHKEIAELKLAEAQAKIEALSKRNTELTRDHEVSAALAGLDFRSDIAADMARDSVLKAVVQDEAGAWKHKSGVSIREFVDHFKKDEVNSFLFKPKTSSGTGMGQPAGTPDMKSNKSITEMNTQEMLAHFAAQAPTDGNFGNF